jgi:hypothetical protein
MSPSGANASTGIGASASSGATGQVQPTSGAVKVDVKVAPTLANTVKISADSAFALAKASPDAGEISSAELEMKDKKFGGLKAAAENQEESKKLYDAKKDSAETKKP